MAAVVLVAGCMPATRIGSSSEGQVGNNRTATPSATVWADSVLRTLTLREKAGQIVWPTLFGDYTSGDSPQWQRLTDYITREKVGGFTISVGSPTEIAAKLNALQSMSSVPLLFGADL